MNRLSTAERGQVIALLVEGASIRSISRNTGRSKNTIVRLLVEVGAACAVYQDRVLRNLPCRRIQCDENSLFCYAKDKNLPAEDKKDTFGYGSLWTWTALDAETRLIATWMVGNRDAKAAKEFIEDLAGRLANRVQLTTDGHKPYVEAVEDGFSSEIDYAMLVKLYGEDKQAETRYSPGMRSETVIGKPMGMHMRRFTRLTNVFSKNLENHIAAISLHFMYHNFCRIHQTLRMTPAIAAGVSSRLWEVVDIVRLLDDAHAVQVRQWEERRDWNGPTR